VRAANVSSTADPEALKRTCDDSLRRLQTDVIDLYYLHRCDKKCRSKRASARSPILIRLGRIRGIGLSEVSAATLRKAHAVHPITAVQSEYSLWTRNPEIGVLNACHELGVTFVAFSPLARGFSRATSSRASSWRRTSAVPCRASANRTSRSIADCSSASHSSPQSELHRPHSWRWVGC